MPYDADPLVLGWFERNLRDERSAVRCRAIEMLEYVACEPRTGWLDRAQADQDPRVAATAALVGAVVASQGEADALELLESDAFDGMVGSDLEWEWEYAVRVCRGWWVPPTSVLVWTRDEDDCLAKELAVMKMTAGEPAAEPVVPVIVGKRAVTRYTRSARSTAEARLWRLRGRPRYEVRGDG